MMATADDAAGRRHLRLAGMATEPFEALLPGARSFTFGASARERGGAPTQRSSSADRAGSVSLLSVPGSGGQRLDAYETGVLLTEALATVDFLRSQTAALEQDRDALLRRVATRAAVAMAPASAGAAPVAVPAEAVRQLCTAALSALETAASRDLAAVRQAADGAVSVLTVLATIAVTCAASAQPGGNCASSNAIAGDAAAQPLASQPAPASHPPAASATQYFQLLPGGGSDRQRELLPLVEGLTALLATIATSTRQCRHNVSDAAAKISDAAGRLGGSNAHVGGVQLRIGAGTGNGTPATVPRLALATPQAGGPGSAVVGQARGNPGQQPLSPSAVLPHAAVLDARRRATAASESGSRNG